jgi:hypothetical protein
MSPPLVLILSQTNTVHNLISYFLIMHFNISLHLRLGLPSGLLHSHYVTKLSHAVKHPQIPNIAQKIIILMCCIGLEINILLPSHSPLHFKVSLSLSLWGAGVGLWFIVDVKVFITQFVNSTMHFYTRAFPMHWNVGRNTTRSIIPQNTYTYLRTPWFFEKLIVTQLVKQ